MVCDSYVRPATLVRICDECNYGSYAGRCVICGGVGISDAFYCKECTVQEKDVSFFTIRRSWDVFWYHLKLSKKCNQSVIAAQLTRLFSCMQRDGCPKIINLVSIFPPGCFLMLTGKDRGVDGLLLHIL